MLLETGGLLERNAAFRPNVFFCGEPAHLEVVYGDEVWEERQHVLHLDQVARLP